MNTIVICIHGDASASSSGGSLVYFDGIAYTERGLVISPQGEGQLNNIKNSEGEWVLVERNEAGVSVYTDMHGYYTVFYGIVESVSGILVYLGNDFSSVCSAVNEHVDYKIDENYCLPMLASYSPFFNTSHSLNTSHVAVKKLAPLTKINISEGKVSLENDDRLSRYGGLSYEELLHAGIDSAAKKYQSFLNDSYAPVFYLSGGRDSRACLSACGDDLSDAFFFSQNPKSYTDDARDIIQRDYDIASCLADILRLKRYSPDGVSTAMIGYYEHGLSVSKKLSNRSNMYNPSLFRNEPKSSDNVVEIRGGGGEVLRSYWSSYFNKIGVANSFTGKNGFGNWRDFSFLYNKLVSRSLFESDSLYKSTQSAFVTELLDINKSTACETLEEHYFLHRNRYHFGHLRASFLTGKACYMPLSNKYFYLASKEMSFDDRRQGKLLYDIIKSSSHSLDAVSYESGKWEWEADSVNELRLEAPPKRVDDNFYPSMHVRFTNTAPAFSKQEYLNSRFCEITYRMKEDPAFSFVGKKLLSFLHDKVGSGSSSSAQVVQKLSSMIDATSQAYVRVFHIF